jgi:hypothetical protein
MYFHKVFIFIQIVLKTIIKINEKDTHNPHPSLDYIQPL